MQFTDGKIKIMDTEFIEVFKYREGDEEGVSR
jgi:hypothetical protein